jgi:uncharacterized surface protein with fasciclin (FAS1) repeats
MSTRRTCVAALAAVAALGVVVSATQTSAAHGGAAAARRVAVPVGPGCDAVPTEGEGSFAGMADDRAGVAAANNPELSTLVGAVEAAALTDALNGEGPFTIFAPNNAAFEQIPANVLDSILADNDLLTSILTFHVVTGQSLAPADLVAASPIQTASGATLELALDGETITINGDESTVVCGPIPVANGTVYIIDSVLQPPSDDLGAGGATTIIDGSVVVIDSSVPTSGPDVTAVATPGDGPQGPLCASLPTEGEGSIEGMADDPAATAAANNPELSTFSEAIEAAGLTDTLNGEAPLTIFAPSNEAFAALPAIDLEAILADPAQLSSILSYHVVEGESLSAADLAAAGTVVTVQGAQLEFTVEADGTLSINGGAAGVSCSNITVGNATVHIIDQLLIPPTA